MLYNEINALHPVEMTETVKKYPGLPENSFFRNMFTPKPLRLHTNVATWDEITRVRRRAPYNVQGAPAQRMDLMERTSRSASTASIFVSKHLTGDQLNYLRALGTTDQPAASALITEELEEMVQAVHQSVEHACMSVIQGSFSVDQTASATAVKSRGVKFTVTFANSTLTSAAAGGGPGKWNVASNLIYTTGMSQIETYMQDNVGVTPTRGILTRPTMDFILKNTEVKEYLSEQYKQQLLTTGHITQIRGVNLEMYAGGDSDSGSFVRYWDDTKILFLPSDGNKQHLQLLEAGQLVPNRVGGDELVWSPPGMYSYAHVTHNPVGIELFVGYNFLPINKYPERVLIYNRDVT